ncbi:hypothetical protein SAFG77S_07135 [Streptomyces afghaniensis]
MLFCLGATGESSLLPLNGNRGPFSVAFSLSSSSKRERRAFLCSLFPLFFLQTGTESLSLFPFLSLIPSNGNRGSLSVPFSLSSPSKRERRASLCSLFSLLFLQTGTEALSLFPFPSLLPPNGNGGSLSVPFSLSSSSKRERRASLCCLFSLFFLQTGTESLSLLPFPSLLPSNGNGEPFSAPFSLSSSSKRERRASLCSLFPLFFLQTGTEALSLFPFLSLLPPNGNGGSLSVPFSLSSSSKREQRLSLCSLFSLFSLQTGTGVSLYYLSSYFLFPRWHRQRFLLLFLLQPHIFYMLSFLLLVYFPIFFRFKNNIEIIIFWI